MGSEFYPGEDLENALEQSSAATRVRRSSVPLSALQWKARSALDHLASAARSWIPVHCEEVVYDGAARETGEPLRVRYVGTTANRPFLASALFQESKATRRRPLRSPPAISGAARRVRDDEDILAVDCDSAVVHRFTPRPALLLPPWVKQRLVLPDSWPGWIESLSRRTRRGVARYLRKYGYRGDREDSREAFVGLYRNLYRPHMTRRFGEDAFVVDEDRFLARCRGAEIIRVLHEGEVVGANVVHASSGCLWMFWCGFSNGIDSRGLKGVADVLDYFSILHAYRLGCGSVDLGRSRPRLNDGLLLYKAKWGASVTLGPLRKPPIVLVPRRMSPGVTSTLAANPWIVRRGARLHGRMLLGGPPVTGERLERSLARLSHPGIERVRLCASSGFDADVRAEVWGRRRFDLVDLSTATDPVDAYLRA